MREDGVVDEESCGGGGDEVENVGKGVMFPEDWELIWMNDLDWTDDILGTEEGVVVTVFWIMVKGKFGVRDLGELKSVGLFNKGASLDAPINGTKSS